MKLSELVAAIYLDQFPENAENVALKDLSKPIKARVDEFQKKFKEYNKDFLKELDNEANRAYITELANNGLRAIDDSKINLVVGLLSPMIGEGTTLSKRFDDREKLGLYDAAMAEVLVNLQSFATGEYIDTSDVPEGFVDKYDIELMVEKIEEIMDELEKLADDLSTLSPEEANSIANDYDNRQIVERIDQLSLQVNLIKSSLVEAKLVN
ncbi:hypothetical protein [Latilactobacillus graminis]|uniref:Uncharacterized protein n=2 Tax=Latilactobacillus graminis TaxID=60519 RepID=A0AA89I2J6_9LACO|nr:hypothetical protein [Latilactobacillus graminis]KRM24215.1 hypothetical protein FC90_GL000692 [Latilactobacillus graminis DSM 20719]QFP78804.1 hypothetical protein LG542_00415 [Latilactobacillus graminis]